MGVACTLRGDWRKALGYFEAALRIEPGAWPPAQSKGIALVRLGEYEQAEAWIRHVLKLRPDRGDVRIWASTLLQKLANGLENQARLDEALDALNRALEADPTRSPAHLDRARVLNNLGEYADALRSIERAEELGVRHAYLHYLRGYALCGLERYRESLAAYECCGDVPYALQGRAWVLATAADKTVRDPDRAVALGERAVHLDRDRGFYRTTLGIAYYRAGRWDAARAAFDKAEGSGDMEEEGWFFVAMVHSKLGHKEEARRWFDRAVAWTEEHKPDDKEFERFRGEAEEVLEIGSRAR
jgi:tetratricopeptide (TPR) repeat protein